LPLLHQSIFTSINQVLVFLTKWTSNGLSANAHHSSSLISLLKLSKKRGLNVQ